MTTIVPPPAPPLTPPPRKGRWLLYGCGGVTVLLLLVVATVMLTFWWLQRPIKPVVLSPKEKAVVEDKLRYVEEPTSPAAPEKRAPPGDTSASAAAGTSAPPAKDRPYVAGSKVLRLTERELNGLLNENTGLGQSVRLEFGRDAINAYLAVPIPSDFPIAGGKMFRARGRFRVSLGNEGAPYAVLEDVTVIGLSLPQAWLGGVKGKNLLADAMGQPKGGRGWRGIKSLRVEPGALLLEVEE